MSWRREPESNRPTRICNPVHNRFAIAPQSEQLDDAPGVQPTKRGSDASPESGAGDEARTRDLNLGKVALYQLSYSRIDGLHAPTTVCYANLSASFAVTRWSGRRGSNSRPQPWQGCALPAELLPPCVTFILLHSYCYMRATHMQIAALHFETNRFCLACATTNARTRL